MDSNFKAIDEAAKAELMIDPALHTFLIPIFPNENERTPFIKRCLGRLKTRRMLLRAQWYTEIADDQSDVRQSRPALNIIFLLAMAEALAKSRTRSPKLSPSKAAMTFFQLILPSDKQLLQQRFRRTLLGPKHHSLRFSSIVRILYEIRNRAVHGEDYYSFSLMDEDQRKGYETGGYTDYGTITSGILVSKSKDPKKRRKQRVSIELTLTYNELRDVFRRTAIQNIKAVL